MKFNCRFSEIHIQKKKKKNLTIVTLLKVTLSVTWQIMQIIKIKVDILNLSLISGT